MKRKSLIAWLCEKFLPLYWQFWPNHWLAVWSAPVLKYGGGWKPKNWKPETHWRALRITLRTGKHGEFASKVIKRGLI